MSKIKNIIGELSRHKSIYFFFVVFFCVGVFLRIYHFSPLMHFELDQARDVFVVHDAVDQGIEQIPLLGPQARGRELYLGPIFYYFQYGSGLIFGASPESAAFPDLLFSILAIPLFYFFARLFFNRTISISLMALVATSLFLIIYGRFAWNPNAMFFWSLVTFYGLLRSYRNKLFCPKWFLLGVFGLAIVMQLHFIAFIVAPLTFVAYMISSRMKVPWKIYGISVIIFIILYIPIIVSDVKNDGRNIKAFFASVTMSASADAESNTASDKKHDVLEQIFRAGQESGTFYWHILSGDSHGRYNVRTKKQEQGYFPLICDERCKTALPYHIFAGLLFIVSSVVFAWRLYVLFQDVNGDKGKQRNAYKRNIYLLIGFWLFFGGAFLIMVAYQISPRFYIFLVAPFFIIFGIFLEWIYGFQRVGKFIFFGIVGILVILNLWAIKNYFDVLQNASTALEKVEWRDISMNRSDFITLAQLRNAADYVDVDMHTGKDFVVVGDNRYARALYYIVSIENGNDDASCYMKRGGFAPEKLAGITYYLLVREASKTHINDEMNKYHDVVNQKSIGTITMYTMSPKEDYTEENNIIEGCFKR